MLQRHAGRPLANQLAQGIEFLVAEGAVELQVQVHPRFAQHVGQEVLDVEPRVVDFLLLKIHGRGLQQLEHGFNGGKTNDE
jgi:hypothetical protein